MESAVRATQPARTVDAPGARRPLLDDVAAARALDVAHRIFTASIPLLRAFEALTTPDERERWVDTRRPDAHAASPEEAGVLRMLATATVAEPAAEHVALARELAACCGGGARYLDVVDSVLHMHLNRRGVPRDEELALRRLIWKALFARRSRRAT